jgi:serine/threonine protein phosphatase 1
MSVARTFVIGDIHGCIEEVDRLLDTLAPSGSDTVIFLGDYIDRGPSPKAVVERLVCLQHEGPRCVFLKGNHEDMFLAFLGCEGAYGEAFLANGGGVTLRSYGLEGQFGELGPDRLPEAHLEFFRALQMRHIHGDFLCVHAGLAPERSLEEQCDEDMLWIRDEFIGHPHPFPYTVLFGHSPRREVLLDLPYKIGLDTGVVYWNKLSCLELESKLLFQIRRAEHHVERRDLLEYFEPSIRKRLCR